MDSCNIFVFSPFMSIHPPENYKKNEEKQKERVYGYKQVTTRNSSLEIGKRAMGLIHLICRMSGLLFGTEPAVISKHCTHFLAEKQDDGVNGGLGLRQLCRFQVVPHCSKFSDETFLETFLQVEDVSDTTKRGNLSDYQEIQRLSMEVFSPSTSGYMG
ncbi:hypothetical protein MKW98_021934 [Papaver atlanticum]|uniref:Uncharacterized protein n=1 Tax=Papaver atlanticum TaxID=357466 RepID=A0AAD4XZY0_9MAGN|nr:hypothetical protein MKW98_021934 [Papaver atlanticum]